MTPIIEKEIRRIFLFDREKKTKDGEKCPGEPNCGIFKIAVSEVGEGNAETAACSGCRMLPTKNKRISSSEARRTLGKCPGEAMCSDFRKDPESACGACPLKNTKPAAESFEEDAGHSGQSKDGTGLTERLLSRIRYLRAERQTRQIDTSLISAIEYRALVIYDYYFERVANESHALQREISEQNLILSQQILMIRRM